MEQKRLILVYAAIIAIVGFSVLVLFTIGKNQTTPTDSTSEELVENPSSRTYKGILPCAVCSGRDVTLVLTKKDGVSAEGTYEMTTIYQGQDVAPVVDKGDWTTEKGDSVDPNATVVVLNPTSTTNAQRFVVTSKDALQELDMSGNPLEIPGQNTTLTLQ